ncbi:MAG: glycogen/starch/alpha-glucan phosphorylase, partial [Aestuariivirga sp.]
MLTSTEFATQIQNVLVRQLGIDAAHAKTRDWLEAAILALRGQITELWLSNARASYGAQRKRVYYLSAEFLIGRMLRDTLHNLGLIDVLREALASLNVDLEIAAALEPDAALGNGGLGRLAACFMESMASLDIPAHGYGIRYRHGLFEQGIRDGQQTEAPETWLENGNPWEVARHGRNFKVNFGGSVTGTHSHAVWQPDETIIAMAYDTPVVGWRSKRVNCLRLWHANPLRVLDLAAFNAGEHLMAQAEGARAEAINRVLYPGDSSAAGHELRLRQQYFFVSASIQDILRRHYTQFASLENLAEHVAIHLNDTHPSMAIAELMRLLLDEEGMAWTQAWAITRKACGYTNHTLLPEALESWPVELLERLLPRHMQIIYLINAEVIDEAHRQDKIDFAYLAGISIIDESHGKRVRMGQLAFVGSHSVNGVSALHSDLMKQTVFRDLNTLYPGRINNKTNGVTPRLWFHQINPALSQLVTEAIGPGFLDDHSKIVDLKAFATDAVMQEKFARAKHLAKERLAKLVHERCGIVIDPKALFDVQIKRIHEYKRQQLAILETVALYLAIKAHPNNNWVPRVKMFAGKAAPGYWAAKNIIRLINDVGTIINADPEIKDLLKVVFVPNYNVSLAETIIPAADLSEQISTAGMEASGTGNMKLAMNGALTIGTLDGANIEIKNAVGDDNIFIFGLTAQEVAERRSAGYRPSDVIDHSPHLMAALSAIADGIFSPGEPTRYHGFVHNLTQSDWFMVMADFGPYSGALNKVDQLWNNPPEWYRKALLNVAGMGWFSSDRTIREYA